MRKKVAIDPEYYIEKYGEQEGLKRWKKICNRKGIKLDANNLEGEIYKGNAIKCLGCGLITTRLQYTHFKYKCNIKSTREYAIKFPNSPLVAPNLAKNTAITEQRMIEKYGELEGRQLWERYRDRQAETNTFEYKSKTYGWSKLDFDEYNSSRACTLTNFINRYGESEGLAKWQNYCERQRYTTSEEYFIERYGQDDGARRFADFCRGRNCVNFKNVKEKEVLAKLNEHLSEKLKYQFFITGIPGCFDFGRNKKVIEFNGDYWHCNPLKYQPDFFHTIKQKTALEIWENDYKKQLLAKQAGYDIMVIWENDWDLNQQKVINNIIEWLNAD
jgi:hypothetical protein